MKKEYTEPEYEIEKFTIGSILTESTHNDDLGNGDDYDWPQDF